MDPYTGEPIPDLASNPYRAAVPQPLRQYLAGMLPGMQAMTTAFGEAAIRGFAEQPVSLPSFMTLPILKAVLKVCRQNKRLGMLCCAVLCCSVLCSVVMFLPALLMAQLQDLCILFSKNSRFAKLQICACGICFALHCAVYTGLHSWPLGPD